ncbi:MAG: DUF2130 domain-containing protein [Nitrososphaerota archaeon]|nr:DUF2130 domain-containing protein [Nitrososphaerota archaeon]
MKSLTIVCPECGHRFPLTNAIQQEIEASARKDIETQLSKKKKKLEAREKELKDLESEFDERLESELQKKSQELKKRAQIEAEENLRVDIKDQETQLDELRGKLHDAQDKELELRKQARKMEEEKEEWDLQHERELDEEKKKLRLTIENEMKGEHELVKKEYEETIRGMTEKIEELNQKAQQGSQQLQGEAQEIVVEDMLKEAFPMDVIEPVPKGKQGADALHFVRTPAGRGCGLIIWESKRTKSWSNDWVRKLKEDQREAKADVAVLVTQALPDGVRNFQPYEGIVVTDFAHFLPLCALLRIQLEAISRTAQSNIGRAEKESLVYNFVLSTEFRQGVQAVAESIISAHQTVGQERAALTRIWKKRESELQKALLSLAAVYGQMQGFADSLPSIPVLELPAVDDDEENKSPR